MADTGQHLQCSARNHRTRSLAIGLWWRDRVRLAQHDRHRLFQRGELLGRKGLHDCRRQQEHRAHAGNGACVVGVGHPWRQLGRRRSGNARLHRVRCRLLLGPADAVIRMCGAEVPQSLQVRSRTGCQQRGVATGREAGDPQALRIDMRAQHRISLHGRQCGTQVIGAQPGQKAAGQGHGVNAVVAWMIHRNHQIPGPRQRRAQPTHHARAAAVAMREQQGRQAITRDRRILGRPADVEQRRVGWTDGQRVFAAAGLCRIPDRVAQRVAVPCVAHGGAGQRRRAVALAGDAAFAGGADARERQQHSSQHSSGHAHLQLLVSGDVLPPAARSPRRRCRCAHRNAGRSVPDRVHRPG